ncbi:MAG: DEAD/DEAH box helicase family protein [Myxococcales bacterium]|nr:DEAD/DEAH box helicase family protein [Myxococcales bacterium]
MGRPPEVRNKAKSAPKLPFRSRLVLFEWALSQLGAESLDALKVHLLDAGLEGVDGDGIHYFHHAIVAHSIDAGAARNGSPPLTKDVLLGYEQNIASHTMALNHRRVMRGEPAIVWKYFQYLMLLFTELYLDRLFRDPKALLVELDHVIRRWNEVRAKAGQDDRLDPFDLDADPWSQLNKVAFWSATGSGKTLILHCNLRQYLHYLERTPPGQSAPRLSRIILLTPNDGLSEQHLIELKAAGIPAERFDPNSGRLFVGRSVEIIDVNKLRESKGRTTVAAEAFEGNNLVFVDEGHRGTSAGDQGQWMRFRAALCERGFSFEYSATFGQAVGDDPALMKTYGRNILFDYSYRHFYTDGYGKEYHILNLDSDASNEAHHGLYLVGCLLAFFQQLHVFAGQETALRRDFGIERPLWVFVGGSVTASLGKQDRSDIMAILHFLRDYVDPTRRAVNVEAIRGIIEGRLVDRTGTDVFRGRLNHPNVNRLDPDALYELSLSHVFNAPGGGALHVYDLKDAAGELALRVGAGNEPFGVVNVGDDKELLELCRKNGFVVGESVTGTSVFRRLNERKSHTNLLIGSRKFTEGWSSWRVSTMGLMHIGKTEGAQIIQLFGRGVRLKGYDFRLRRSAHMRLPPGVVRPEGLPALETLNVFGVQATYMAQFRDFLEKEGVPTFAISEGTAKEVFLMPVISGLGDTELKMIARPKRVGGKDTTSGADFRALAPNPTMDVPDTHGDVIAQALRRSPVNLDWYPRIQAMGSTSGPEALALTKERGIFTRSHVALMDLDRLHSAMIRMKSERGWNNVNLPRSSIASLLADTDWYHLEIPPNLLRYQGRASVRLWEEIIERLLGKYLERVYRLHKQAWDTKTMRLEPLSPADQNLLGQGDTPGDPYYAIEYEVGDTAFRARLEELKALILSGQAQHWEFGGLKTVMCDRHLFWPLLTSSNGSATLTPIGLNADEARFVEDLKRYHDQHAADLESTSLYLLRNLSRGRGLGFFEAGNFHPDFIVWQVRGGHQYIAFVDPKGVRQVKWDDPKLLFSETVRELEGRLGDETVHLSSFIVSKTPFREMQHVWPVTREEMTARHVVFQEDESYVADLLRMAREPSS